MLENGTLKRSKHDQKINPQKRNEKNSEKRLQKRLEALSLVSIDISLTLCIDMSIDILLALLLTFLLTSLLTCYWQFYWQLQIPTRVSSESINRKQVWWVSLSCFKKTRKFKNTTTSFHQTRSIRNTFDESPCRCFKKDTKKSKRHYVVRQTRSIRSTVDENPCRVCLRRTQKSGKSIACYMKNCKNDEKCLKNTCSFHFGTGSLGTLGFSGNRDLAISTCISLMFWYISLLFGYRCAPKIGFRGNGKSKQSWKCIEVRVHHMADNLLADMSSDMFVRHCCLTILHDSFHLEEKLRRSRSGFELKI